MFLYYPDILKIVPTVMSGVVGICLDGFGHGSECMIVQTDPFQKSPHCKLLTVDLSC